MNKAPTDLDVLKNEIWEQNPAPQPPAHGDAAREAISAIICSMSEQTVNELTALKAEIETLEKTLLVSAARLKANLDEHVAINRYAREEAGHVRDALDRMREAHAQHQSRSE